MALAQVARKGLGIAVKDVITWDNTRLADLEERLRRQREVKAGQPTAGQLAAKLPARPIMPQTGG